MCGVFAGEVGGFALVGSTIGRENCLLTLHLIGVVLDGAIRLMILAGFRCAPSLTFWMAIDK